MATIVTRTGKGSALTTAEMDANLNNLNTDKIESVNDDTSPQLGGDLDIGANNITTTTANGSINLLPIGTGAVNIQGNEGLQVTGDNTDALVFTATTNSNLTIRANGSGVIKLDDASELGGAMDVNNQNIVNNQTNGNIVLAPNGTGVVAVSATNGLTVSSGNVTATDTNANLTLSADGTGYIALNQAGGVVVTDTAASGFGIVTGETAKGLGMLTNGGSDTATDPALKLTNGGGAELRAGSGSTLSLKGNLIDLVDPTDIGDLKAYAETIQTLSGVSGTLTIDPTAGPIKYVVPSGNITINGFSSPVAGQTVTFLIDNATAATSYTLTLGAAVLVPGGSAPALTASGNDLLTITCIDSATPVYIANVVNDFQ